VGVKGGREQGVLSSSSLDSKLCDGLLGRGNRCMLVVAGVYSSALSTLVGYTYGQSKREPKRDAGRAC